MVMYAQTIPRTKAMIAARITPCFSARVAAATPCLGGGSASTCVLAFRDRRAISGGALPQSLQQFVAGLPYIAGPQGKDSISIQRIRGYGAGCVVYRTN